MHFDAPIWAPPETVQGAWIDHNGHLNMAYYNVLFDHAVDYAFELLGCGPAYVKARRLSFFTAECHVCYLRELKEGDSVRGSIQLIEHDGKRLRIYQELHHENGWLSATSEGLFLHVDLAGPKVTPFPADIGERIAALGKAHAAMPMPERAGRAIGLGRRPRGAT